MKLPIKINRKDSITVFLAAFVLLVIPLTVFVTTQVRDNRSKAATPVNKNTSYAMPVLVLKYFPPDPNNDQNLDPSITGLNNVTLSNIRSHVEQITTETKAALQSGSVYHGYKDPSATPALNYSILDQKEYLTALPIGIEVPWKPGQGVYRPDYGKILTDLNICNYVNNQGLREVWLYGWHYDNIEPAESVMSGPHGDTSNSGGGNFQMPVCSKSYILYNYNYSRGTKEAVHNHGHQIEVMMKRVGDPMFENNFIGPFSTYGSNDGSGANFHRCGWTHTPPNTNGDYDYTNTRYSWTDCEDWRPDGSGQKTYINCDRWLCDQTKYHIWRWQSMPGKNNTIPGASNWWDFVGDWDAALNSSEKLLYTVAAPSIPTGLVITNIFGDRLTLSWNPSTGTQIDYYIVKRNGVEVARVNTTHLTDFTVLPNTGYSYTVSASDSSGDASADSNPLSATTNNLTAPALSRPTLDYTSSKVGNNLAGYSWFHTTGLGTDRMLIVALSIRKAGTVSVQSLTYDGVPLTLVGFSDQGSMRTEFWKLSAPSSGRKQVAVLLSGIPGGSVASAVSWYGVDQANISYLGSVGASTNPSVTIPSSTTAVVQDVLSMPNLSSDTVSAGLGQTQIWNLYSGGDTKGAGSYKSGSVSTTMSWNTKWEAWSLSAISLELKTKTKIGDLNGDGKVNILDVSRVIDKWGATNKPPEDINQDNRVDIQDISILIDNWG